MIKEYQLRKLQNTYEVTLNYKGVKVRVAFTGGNVYNSTMPKFRTNDAFKQKAIEESELFKNKEVVILRTINDSKAAPQPVVQQRRKPMRRPVATTPLTATPVQQPVVASPETPTVTESQGTVTTGEEDGLTKKTFDNLGDAILYVAQTWQIQTQNEGEVRKVLKEHGINPTIKRG